MSEVVSSHLAELMMDCKSKETYDRWIRKYKNYCEESQSDLQAFIVFMDWIKGLSNAYQVSSIWQAASCVNKYMLLTYNKTFIKEIIFKSFMKHIGKSYKPVKSATLSLDNVYDYTNWTVGTFANFTKLS